MKLPEFVLLVWLIIFTLNQSASHGDVYIIIYGYVYVQGTFVNNCCMFILYNYYECWTQSIHFSASK